MNTKRIGPLAGYRVLELGSTVAGPFCGRLLADFGAEVIKVEPPEGDAVRSMGKHVGGTSLYAASIFRNKSLIALDLRKPEAQDIVRRIVAHCDIVVENFRPGGLDRWNLGYEHLSKLYPRLIMVRISGFGQTGPYKDRPGYGFLGDAVGGLLNINGYPDHPPTRAAVPVTDMVTAIYGAFGALMAVLNRDKTGRGQCIDAALYETAFSLMESHVPAYEKLRSVPKRSGSRLPGSTPNNLYPTRDGGYIALAAASDPVFRRLAATMGRADLIEDRRFATAIERNRNHDVLDEIISQWTCCQDLQPLEARLHAADIPASRVFTMADIFSDAHFRARQMLVEVPDEELGSVTLAGPVPRLSETPGELRHSGGIIGRDTKEILRTYAGIADNEFARLKAAGVVA